MSHPAVGAPVDDGLAALYPNVDGEERAEDGDCPLPERDPGAHENQGKLHVEGRLEGTGKVVPVAFNAVVHRVDHGLQMEVAAMVDGQQLGKRGGQLRMILPATVHVTARLTPQRSDSWLSASAGSEGPPETRALGLCEARTPLRADS